MKYIIEEYVLNEYNASSKAREDVSYYVLKNGFTSFAKNDKTKIRHSKMAKAWLGVKLLTKIMMLGEKDILFLQTSELVLKPILTIKKIRRFKVVYLIHDLFCLRFNTPKSIEENQKEIQSKINLVSQCDCIIAHNDRMIERFRSVGCNTTLVPLAIFDYYTDLETPQRKLSDKIKVAFAGNIKKSKFLTGIDKVKHTYDLIVYGGPSAEFKNADYRGCVDPAILPNVIDGHFGLIWEGDYEAQSVDNYNIINNPHKLSMYIVAGLPIIAWRGSYAAEFAEKYQIGFGIDSLDELDERLDKIDSTMYSQYTTNCVELAKQLKSGVHMHNALKNATASL